jgi:TldD protein
MNGYFELREHILRKQRLMMVKGNLVANESSTDIGASARYFHDGYWGFAAVNALGPEARLKVQNECQTNARAMAGFGNRVWPVLPKDAIQMTQTVSARPDLTQAEIVERLLAINAYCEKLSGVKSVRIIAGQESHEKTLSNALGSMVHNEIRRALAMVTLIGEDASGAPAEASFPVSCKGSFADLNWTMQALETKLLQWHEHLMAKTKAVQARGGEHTVIIAPALAGMLAHEAMGHPCEADLVLGGAVTGTYRGKRIASDLVSVVDYAHHIGDQECIIPVYADDEGTPSVDTVLIKDGILTDFMNSRDTAAQMGDAATGSARAYGPNDEPCVRMRNTGIVPGSSKLADMISEVDDGYLLLSTGNGQADSTTEFMFGISMGYEIRNGKLANAIKDTTVSGSAIKVLQSVDAVSDDNEWGCSGYCGKKQPMIVSMGGPALRARAQIGGA